METNQKNKISIWIGNFYSQEELDVYLEKKYSEDGDAVSNFMNDFKISYYDEDFQEAYYDKEKKEVSELMEPLSYSEMIIPKLTNLKEKYNSVVCLYNYEYNMSVIESDKLKLVGVYDINNS